MGTTVVSQSVSLYPTRTIVQRAPQLQTYIYCTSVPREDSKRIQPNSHIRLDLSRRMAASEARTAERVPAGPTAHRVRKGREESRDA